MRSKVTFEDVEKARAEADSHRRCSWIFLSLSAAAFAGGLYVRSIALKEIGGVFLLGVVGCRMGMWIENENAHKLLDSLSLQKNDLSTSPSA